VNPKLCFALMATLALPAGTLAQPVTEKVAPTAPHISTAATKPSAREDASFAQAFASQAAQKAFLELDRERLRVIHDGGAETTAGAVWHGNPLRF